MPSVFWDLLHDNSPSQHNLLNYFLHSNDLAVQKTNRSYPPPNGVHGWKKKKDFPGRRSGGGGGEIDEGPSERLFRGGIKKLIPGLTTCIELDGDYVGK